MPELTLFVGGPLDGELKLVDRHAPAVYAPLPTEPRFEQFPDDGKPVKPARIATATYEFRKIVTPDRWIERVLVCTDTNLYACSEAELLRFIMTGWRARHAAAAAAKTSPAEGLS